MICEGKRHFDFNRAVTLTRIRQWCEPYIENLDHGRNLTNFDVHWGQGTEVKGVLKFPLHRLVVTPLIK